MQCAAARRWPSGKKLKNICPGPNHGILLAQEPVGLRGRGGNGCLAPLVGTKSWVARNLALIGAVFGARCGGAWLHWGVSIRCACPPPRNGKTGDVY